MFFPRLPRAQDQHIWLRTQWRECIGGVCRKTFGRTGAVRYHEKPLWIDAQIGCQIVGGGLGYGNYQIVAVDIGHHRVGVMHHVALDVKIRQQKRGKIVEHTAFNVERAAQGFDGGEYADGRYARSASRPQHWQRAGEAAT